MSDSPPYRVLARKYRPSTFDALIGQQAMVRTLSNAIKTGRLAHAFILTGVRGVGKTTTARLIARALNCIGPDGQGGPTVSPCGVCEHCKSIAESRSVDVLEMDAASRTGIDDIREIIDSIAYAPVSARFKIYIIDEVHMLSKNAFNGLLKTLEEPPAHVKFIFATTEIRKVPVTVLSRCQRFDLRRVEQEALVAHFSAIAAQEGASIEPGALALIARAAEGSVRDGLSLLDQAIAHGAGAATESQVRDMLGLADRARVLDLYDSVMKGDIKTALGQLRAQYDLGADPAVVLGDMLEITHWLTRLKVAPGSETDNNMSEAERSLGGDMADKLPVPALTRAWQMLLKGLEETRQASSPIQAAEMALIRLAFAADLPNPADLVRQLKNAPPQASSQTSPQTPVASPSGPSGGGAGGYAVASHGASAVPRLAPDPVAAPTALAGPATFAALIDLCHVKGDMILEAQLHDLAHVVRFEPGRIDLRLEPSAPKDLMGRLGEKLAAWTGQRWIITHSNETGQPTAREAEEARKHARHQDALADPLLQAALKLFPGAEITEVRNKGIAAATTMESGPAMDAAMDFDFESDEDIP